MNRLQKCNDAKKQNWYSTNIGYRVCGIESKFKYNKKIFLSLLPPFPSLLRVKRLKQSHPLMQALIG